VIKNAQILKEIVSIFIMSLAINGYSQNREFCAPIEVIISGYDNNREKILIIDEVGKFTDNGFEGFKKLFNSDVNSSVIKSAYKKFRKASDFQIYSCVENQLLISFNKVDSLRREGSMTSDIAGLEDSINTRINEIFANFKGKERDSLHNKLLQSKEYRKLKSSKDQTEYNFLFFSNPIVVNNKFLFLQTDVINSSRHFSSEIYLFKKEDSSWSLIKKATY